MSVSIQHVSNRASDTDVTPRLFRNDLNNVAALQNARFQKKLMEEAARLQKQQLEKVEEDKEKVVQERDALRAEKEQLNQTVQQKDSSLAVLQTAKEEVEKQMEVLKSQKEEEIQALTRQKENEGANLRRQMDDQAEALRKNRAAEITVWEAEKRTLQDQVNSISAKDTEIQSLKQSKGELEKLYAFGGKENCLPPEYHNAEVMIVNVRSQRTLDAGKGEIIPSSL